MEPQIPAFENADIDLSEAGLLWNDMTYLEGERTERREYILLHEQATYYFTIGLGFAVAGALYLIIFQPSAQ